MQRALIQYRKPQNYDLVLEALRKTGRMDLVGFDKKCLIRPRRNKKNTESNEDKKELSRNTKERKNTKFKDDRNKKNNRKSKPRKRA